MAYACSTEVDEPSASTQTQMDESSISSAEVIVRFRNFLDSQFKLASRDQTLMEAAPDNPGVIDRINGTIDETPWLNSVYGLLGEGRKILNIWRDRNVAEVETEYLGKGGWQITLRDVRLMTPGRSPLEDESRGDESWWFFEGVESPDPQLVQINEIDLSHPEMLATVSALIPTPDASRLILNALNGGQTLETIGVKLGEETISRATGISVQVTFVAVVEDTRCLENAVCDDPGRAVINLGVVVGGLNFGEMELSLREGVVSAPTKLAGDLSIQFLDLQSLPFADGSEATDYTAFVQVIR